MKELKKKLKIFFCKSHGAVVEDKNGNCPKCKPTDAKEDFNGKGISRN